MVEVQMLVMGLIMAFMVLAAIATFTVTCYMKRKKKSIQKYEEDDSFQDDPNAVVVDVPAHKMFRSNVETSTGMHDMATKEEEPKGKDDNNIEESGNSVEDEVNVSEIAGNDKDGVDVEDAKTEDITNVTADAAAVENLDSQ